MSLSFRVVALNQSIRKRININTVWLAHTEYASSSFSLGVWRFYIKAFYCETVLWDPHASIAKPLIVYAAVMCLQCFSHYQWVNNCEWVTTTYTTYIPKTTWTIKTNKRTSTVSQNVWIPQIRTAQIVLHNSSLDFVHTHHFLLVFEQNYERQNDYKRNKVC